MAKRMQKEEKKGNKIILVILLIVLILAGISIIVINYNDLFTNKEMEQEQTSVVAPKILGITSGIKKEPQTIIFDDIESVKTAILKQSEKEDIDLVNMYINGELNKNDEGKYTYTINENGRFSLMVTDNEDNKTIIDFTIKNLNNN